jgi:hypothetical protein
MCTALTLDRRDPVAFIWFGKGEKSSPDAVSLPSEYVGRYNEGFTETSGI